MESQVLVIAEHDGAALDPLTFDLLAWGARIAQDNGWTLGVMVVGAGIDALAVPLRKAAADTLWMLDDPTLGTYNPVVYCDAIASALPAPPRLVLLGHSYMGIEMAGALAHRFNATSWTNCLSIEATSNGYHVTRPVAGGAFASGLAVDADSCHVFTLQRGATPHGEIAAKQARVVALAMPLAPAPATIRVIAESKATFAEDITKADLLVSVGRGIGQQSQLAACQDLARLLGGTIAASRPLVDLGWLPVDHQVGLSGRTVRPKVYIACGISGAMQHLLGMRESRLVIAINNDANAPIFQVAHYGIVADILTLLPALAKHARLSGKNAGAAA